MTSAALIRLLVLDLDGVITDGTILLTSSGDEVRAVHFRDLDAVARIQQRGVDVAIVSGEDTAASRRVAGRFGIGEAVWGAKDKWRALQELTKRLAVPIHETCYIGDADRDAPALAAVGFGLAPADASAAARSAADHVLDAPGGRGAVAEAVSMLELLSALPRKGATE
jgi:3-deoxy-D-manno-octulosonate 8-phosphate phosphatase (KDO 8-P phosphatase)